MAGPYIPGKIGGNQQVADRWSRYASDNSYHPTKSEKAGGAPKMQCSERSEDSCDQGTGNQNR